MHSIQSLSTPISLCPPLHSRPPLTHKSPKPRTLDHHSSWMVRQLWGGGGGGGASRYSKSGPQTSTHGVWPLNSAHLDEGLNVLVTVVGKRLLGGGVHLCDAVSAYHQQHTNLALTPVVLGCLEGLQGTARLTLPQHTQGEWSTVYSAAHSRPGTQLRQDRPTLLFSNGVTLSR